MGEDRPIGGYGIPTGVANVEANETEVPPHPAIQELRHAIEELKTTLNCVRGERDRLFKQIELMIAQGKEGL